MVAGPQIVGRLQGHSGLICQTLFHQPDHFFKVPEKDPVFETAMARRELKRLMTWPGWSAGAAEVVPPLASLIQRYSRRCND
jgi:hypothetical protein